MAQANIHIGTSGFSYKDWLGNFYPQFCPPADFLKYYASMFVTVEIDSTFYRIPADTAVARWAKTTPAQFVFAAKFPRTVTHEGELSSRLETAAEFVKVMKALGSKLGPLLLQFPYSFKPDQQATLMALIEAMPSDRRIAIELRNKQWLDETAVFDRMKDQNIAFCLIDHPFMPRLDIQTADFSYLRFLGDRKKIEADFSYVRFERGEDLAWWSTLIEQVAGEGKDLFAYVNNHYSGHSPSTARQLVELLEARAQ